MRTACRDTAGLLTERFDLRCSVEEPLTACADGSRIGTATVLTGAGAVACVVLVTLAVGPAESEMLCAFTQPESAVPHFAMDVIAGADATALHLDLLPRVDLATHPSYVEHCFDPLTPAATALLDHPDVQQTPLPRRQLALMSRWAITCQLPPAVDDVAAAAVAAYRDHWLRLTAGLPGPVVSALDDVDLAARDRRHRGALFAPDLDPVWPMLSELVGVEAAERVRRVLAGDSQPGTGGCSGRPHRDPAHGRSQF